MRWCVHVQLELPLLFQAIVVYIQEADVKDELT